MKLYCLPEFKESVEQLRKNRSYATLDREVIAHFCDQPIEQLRSGTLLNNNLTTPYLKKRLGGSGGFRVYYLLLIVADCVYLLYVHPKTGSRGSENMTAEAKAALYKNVLAAIKADDLYTVTHAAGKLIFAKKTATGPL